MIIDNEQIIQLQKQMKQLELQVKAQDAQVKSQKVQIIKALNRGLKFMVSLLDKVLNGEKV
jgi:hypothetical protein